MMRDKGDLARRSAVFFACLCDAFAAFAVKGFGQTGRKDRKEKLSAKYAKPVFGLPANLALDGIEPTGQAVAGRRIG